MSRKFSKSYSKFKTGLKLYSFQKYFIELDIFLKERLGDEFGILWFLDNHYTEEQFKNAVGLWENVRHFPCPTVNNNLCIFYPSTRRNIEIRSIQGLATGIFVPRFNWRNISGREHFVEMYSFIFFKFSLHDFIRCLLYDYKNTVYYIRLILDEE